MALAFKFSPLLSYLHPLQHNTLDDIIINLNNSITQADTDIGCPLKAVSFHETIEVTLKVLQWEMIIDI